MIRYVITALAWVASLGADDRESEALKASFEAEMRPVNRVVVREGQSGAEGPDMVVLFDKTDRAAIETLLVHFEPAQTADTCMCIGDTLVEFFRDEEFVMGFSVHHLFRLRGHSASWSGDLELAGEMNTRFWVGFAAIGYDGFVATRAKREAERVKSDEKWATFLDLFPENARGALSRGRTMEEMLDMHDGARLFAALGDSVETVETLWRAVGWEARATRLRGQRYRDQPMQSLYRALAKVSAATQMEALRRLESSESAAEDLVKLGAAVYLAGASQEDETWSDQVPDALRGRLAARLLAEARSRSPKEEADVLDAFLRDDQPAFHAVLIDWLKTQSPTVSDSVDNEVSAAVQDDCSVSEAGPPRPLEGLAQVSLHLAEAGVVDALPEIRRLQDAATDPTERLALDVALATLDPTASKAVGEAHLTSRVEAIADAALAVARADRRDLPLPLLVAMAKEEVDPWGIELEFIEPDSAKAWARSRLAEMGVQVLRPSRPSRFEPTTCEARAESLVAKGDYIGAVAAYGRLFRERAHPLSEVWALLATGRTEKALEIAYMLVDYADRERHGGVKIADAMAARGATFFVLGQFDAAARDFAAASRLHRDNWFTALEFVATSLDGHPERSSLVDWAPFVWRDEPPSRSWPNVGLLFLQGKASAEELLAKASTGQALSRAHWLLAMQARLAGDEATETAHLGEVLALDDFTDAIHVLALLRERQLRWARDQ